MHARIILVFLLMFGFSTFAQPDTLNLYLINPKNKSEKKLNQGKRIRVWKTETDVIKGKYTVASDSTIKVGDEVLAIKDLNSVKCSTKEDMFGSAVAGVLPLVFTTMGIVDLSKNTLGIGTKLFILESGIGVGGLTGCTIGFLYGRQRKTEKGWKYTIK
ncbi:MAG: hypothetical protein R2780_09880 [Crocinitomicaceae bacterium]